MPGNVHPPQFPEEPNNVIINEAATVGTIVTQVKVSDTGHDVMQDCNPIICAAIVVWTRFVTSIWNLIKFKIGEIHTTQRSSSYVCEELLIFISCKDMKSSKVKM